MEGKERVWEGDWMHEAEAMLGSTDGEENRVIHLARGLRLWENKLQNCMKEIVTLQREIQQRMDYCGEKNALLMALRGQKTHCKQALGVATEGGTASSSEGPIRDTINFKRKAMEELQATWEETACFWLRGLVPRKWTEATSPILEWEEDIGGGGTVSGEADIFTDGFGGKQSSDDRLRRCGWGGQLYKIGENWNMESIVGV